MARAELLVVVDEREHLIHPDGSWETSSELVADVHHGDLRGREFVRERDDVTFRIEEEPEDYRAPADGLTGTVLLLPGATDHGVIGHVHCIDVLD
ncbi:hypothetical protein ACFPYI_14885 [Halomarina salina]|uniref:Uncharacterized protein n=1 Tax=Halomarina salina TaxID=1872699 RepID=A0ABD5RQ20_9EURY|nr:hypothetical protein [Halomarina salina]